MDYQGKAESGLHLLARLSTRPSVVGLDDVVFPEGPNANEVIDIVGNVASGKTLLITQLLAKCLLPQQWEEREIGGLGVGAIIIDTDHHFHLTKLVNLMEHKLQSLKNESNASSVRLNSKTIETIIKYSLTNLIILNCFDSSQLFVTFHSLTMLLAKKTNISLILIDSICAYYWQDVMMGGIRKMDLYLKRILETLQKCVKEHKVVIGYTRPDYFQSKVRDSRDVVATYQVNLDRKEIKGEQDLFSVEINSSNGKLSYRYEINDGGLRWLWENPQKSTLFTEQ